LATCGLSESTGRARGGLVDLEFPLDEHLVDYPGFFSLVRPEMEADLVARFLVCRVKGLPGIVKGAGSVQVDGIERQLEHRAAMQLPASSGLSDKKSVFPNDEVKKNGWL